MRRLLVRKVQNVCMSLYLVYSPLSFASCLKTDRGSYVFYLRCTNVKSQRDQTAHTFAHVLQSVGSCAECHDCKNLPGVLVGPSEATEHVTIALV